MYRGTTVVVETGKDIPDDYLQLAVDNNKSCWGMAWADGGVFTIEHVNEKPSVAAMQSMRQDTEFGPDRQMAFWLGDSPVEFNAKCIQPFTVLEEGDQPSIVAFIDGDFSKYQQPDSPLSAEFFLASTFLTPKLKTLHRLCKGDLAAIKEEIDSESFQQDIKNTADKDGRCNITLLYTDGDFKIFTHSNAQAKKTDFGWVSNDHGWGGTPPPKPKEVPKPSVPSVVPGMKILSEEELNKLSPKEKIQYRRALAAAKAEPSPTATPDNQKSADDANKNGDRQTKDVPPTQPTPAKDGGMKPGDSVEYVIEKRRPPSNLQDKKDVRDWYLNNATDEKGILIGPKDGINPPPGYKGTRPAAWVKVAKSDIQKKEEAQATLKTLSAIGPALAAKAGNGESVPITSAKVAAKVELPVSMAQEARYRTEFLADDEIRKIQGLSNEEIGDPRKIDDNAKVGLFAQRFDWETFAKTFSWAPEHKLRLIKEFPEVALLLLQSYQYLAISHAAAANRPLVHVPKKDKEEKAA